MFTVRNLISKPRALTATAATATTAFLTPIARPAPYHFIRRRPATTALSTKAPSNHFIDLLTTILTSTENCTGAVVGVSFVYVALAWATQRTTPSTTAITMTLQPPLNALLSVMFLHRTSFSWGELLGGVLVMAGLVVTASQQGASDKGILLANNADQDAEAGSAGGASGLDLEIIEVRTRDEGKGRGKECAHDKTRAPPLPDEDELEVDYGSDEVLLDESDAPH